MRTFREKVRARLIENRSEVVVEAKSSANNLRRWIAVYPKFIDTVDKTIPDHEFSILDFELDVFLIDTYFSEEDKQNQKRRYVNNEDELYSALGLMGLNPENFDAPWRFDYPL